MIMGDFLTLIPPHREQISPLARYRQDGEVPSQSAVNSPIIWPLSQDGGFSLPLAGYWPRRHLNPSSTVCCPDKTKIDKDQCGEELDALSRPQRPDGSNMMHAETALNIDFDDNSTPSGERFLANIRLFLAFKKGAGQNTIREEFLLESLVEMHQRLYGRRTAAEFAVTPQIKRQFEHEIPGY
jgi:hypothetical protein